MTLLFFWQGGVFDYEKINKDIENLNQLITDSNNWDNISLINQSQEKLKQNKNVINEFDFINNQFSQLKDFIDIFDSLNGNEINDLVHKMIDIKKKCEGHAKKLGLNIEFKQSNVEGEIVNFIQEARKKYDGIIINAGGYTHTSVAVLDALLAVKKPTIELHITNIYKREDFRHKSLISRAADGIICGLGADGYVMALDGIKKIINNENW